MGIEPRALSSNRTPQLPNNDQELLSPAVLKLSSQSMEKAFILYDLEATCWRTSRPKRVEIIEVGAVKVNADLEIVSEYCAFVRPMVHPSSANSAPPSPPFGNPTLTLRHKFDEVMEDYEDWMGVGKADVIPMSWGDFDKRQLLTDAALHDMQLDWLDAHVCFQKHFGKWKKSQNQVGLKKALEERRDQLVWH